MRRVLKVEKSIALQYLGKNIEALRCIWRYWKFGILPPSDCPKHIRGAFDSWKESVGKEETFKVWLEHDSKTDCFTWVRRKGKSKEKTNRIKGKEKEA